MKTEVTVNLMPPDKAERHLDAWELSVLGTPFAIGIEYQGDLDATRLARAYENLCARHPILRTQIHQYGGGAALYLPPDHTPTFVVDSGDFDTLMSRICGPWNPAQTTTQLILVTNGTSGYVALRADHAIADGRGNTEFIRQLMTQYVHHNAEEASLRTAFELPRPPTEILSNRLGRDNFHATPPGSIDVSKWLHRPIGGQIQFSEEATTNLRQAARDNETTVYGLVTGSIMAAHRTECPQRGAVQMTCYSPVDFRTRVAPPVGVLETTNFALMHQSDVMVTDDAEPARTGKAIKARMRVAATTSTGDKHDGKPGCLENNLAHAFVSNVGVIHELPNDTTFNITNFYWLNESTSLPMPLYWFYTFKNKMTLGYVFDAGYFTVTDGTRLIGKICGNLHRTISGDQNRTTRERVLEP